MDIKHQSIILDVNKVNILPNIIAHQGDQKTRFIDVTLTMSGEELILNDSYRAILKASNNGEVKAINDCEIDLEQNIIIVELTSTMLDTAGFLNCEITVVDEDKYITSQNFMVEVSLSTVSDEDEIETSKEYGTLVRLMNEVSKIESDAKVVKDIISHLAEITDIDELVNSKADKETVENELAKKANLTDLDTKENISNKVNTIDFPSTNYYPSSKAVWDYVTSKISTLISNIENLKNSKVDVTDFNTFKDTTNQTITNQSTDISANAKSIEDMKAELDKKDKFIKNLAIKNTTEKSSGVVLNDSSDLNIIDISFEDTENHSVDFYGKNLFDISGIKLSPNSMDTNTVVDKEKGTVDFDMTPGTNRGLYFKWCETYMSGSKYRDKTFTLSVIVTSDKDCTFRLFDETSYKMNKKAITANVPTLMYLTFNQTSEIGTKGFSFYGIDVTENTHITLKNIMLELSDTPTDFESYKQSQQVSASTDLSNVHTYYKTTTVIADSDFVLTYIADPKNYINSKVR